MFVFVHLDTPPVSRSLLYNLVLQYSERIDTHEYDADTSSKHFPGLCNIVWQFTPYMTTRWMNQLLQALSLILGLL